MSIKDQLAAVQRFFLRFKGKGGKEKELPVRRNLEEFLDEYLKATGLWRSFVSGRHGPNREAIALRPPCSEGSPGEYGENSVLIVTWQECREHKALFPTALLFPPKGFPSHMNEIQPFLNALPEAAKSPAALAAYVVTLTVWGWLTWRGIAVKGAYEQIKNLPESERSAVVNRVMGEPLPPNLDPAQWLLYKLMRYVFYAGAMSMVLIVVLVAMALFYVIQKRGIEEKSVRLDDVRSVIPPITPVVVPTVSTSAKTLEKTLPTPGSPFPIVFEGDPSPKRVEHFTYIFDFIVRNSSSRQEATITKARISFDPNLAGGLATVIPVSGTYIVQLDPNETTVETAATGEKTLAEAWYSSAGGNLIVIAPLPHKVEAGKADRFRLMVKIAPDFELRGPMETAEIELTCNGDQILKSGVIKLPRQIAMSARKE